MEENKTLLVDHPVPVQNHSVHQPEKPAYSPQQSHHAPAGRGRGGRGPQRGKGQRGGHNHLSKSHKPTLLEMVSDTILTSVTFVKSLCYFIILSNKISSSVFNVIPNVFGSYWLQTFAMRGMLFFSAFDTLSGRDSSVWLLKTVMKSQL